MNELNLTTIEREITKDLALIKIEKDMEDLLLMEIRRIRSMRRLEALMERFKTKVY